MRVGSRVDQFVARTFQVIGEAAGQCPRTADTWSRLSPLLSRLSILAAVVLCLASTEQAAASTTFVNYQINVASFDQEFGSNNRESVRRVAQLAALAWHDRAGYSTYFRYIGDTMSTVCTGTTALVYAQKECHPVLGCSLLAQNKVYECQSTIVFYLDSTQFVLTYPTQTNPFQYDFQTVLAHEFGHYFFNSYGGGFDGNGHLNNTDCMMHQFAQGGMRHTPCDQEVRARAGDAVSPRMYRKQLIQNGWGTPVYPSVVAQRNFIDFEFGDTGLDVASNEAAGTSARAYRTNRDTGSVQYSDAIQTGTETLRRVSLAYDSSRGVQWAFDIGSDGLVRIYRSSFLSGWSYFGTLLDPVTQTYVQTLNPVSATYSAATDRVVIGLISDDGPAVPPCGLGCRNESRVITVPGWASSVYDASTLFRFGSGSGFAYAGTGPIAVACKPGVGTSATFQCEAVQTGLDSLRLVWGWSFGIGASGQLTGYSAPWTLSGAAALGDVSLAFSGDGLEKTISIRGYDNNVWSWRARYDAAGTLVWGGSWASDGITTYRGPVMKWIPATAFAPWVWGMFVE